jgi:hypothetical protein
MRGLRFLVLCLAIPGLAKAGPEVSEGEILELHDPVTGDRTMGYAYDMELAPAALLKREKSPRLPLSRRKLDEAVICWVEFAPRPNGLPGRAEIKDCPAPFNRAVRRATRWFRFFPYEATGQDPIYVHRMVFGEEPAEDSSEN